MFRNHDGAFKKARLAHGLVREGQTETSSPSGSRIVPPDIRSQLKEESEVRVNPKD